MTFKVLSFLIVTCIVLPCWTENSGENDHNDPRKVIVLSASSLKLSSELSEDEPMHSVHYDSRNVIVTRAQFYNNMAFVALPRYKQGVPFTLGSVDLEESPKRIKPYPCMAMQEENYCQAIQSVVDVFYVNLNLFALDVGIVNTLEQPIRHCSPKIVIITTYNDKVEKTIDLSDLVTAESCLQYLVVDETFNVYVADAGTQSILVYDAGKEDTYRKVLPEAKFPLNKVFSIALTIQNSADTLFFTFLSSPRLYSIKTDYLKNRDQNINDSFIVEVEVKPKEMILLGAGKSSLYFRYVGENDIYEWKTDKAFEPENLHTVHRGGNGHPIMQVLHDSNDEIWALENNFQDFESESTGCDGALTKLHPILLKKPDESASIEHNIN